MENSEFPDFNFDLEKDITFSVEMIESNAVLRYGRDADDNTKRIVIHKITTFNRNANTLDLDQDWSLKWDAMVRKYIPVHNGGKI